MEDVTSYNAVLESSCQSFSQNKCYKIKEVTQ